MLGLSLDVLNHLRNFFRCLRRALCELAHFIGDDSESASLLTRPRGFDRSVESEKIGLVGDVVDDTDDFANLLRALAQLFDLLRGVAHRVSDRAHAGESFFNDLSTRPSSISSAASGIRGLVGVL